MTKPELFISTTDYPTLKNDDRGSVSVTVPASLGIANNTTYTNSADLVIGAQYAESRLRINSNLLGLQYYLGQLLVNRLGVVSGSPTPYTIFAIISRINATTVRCTTMIPNTYGAILTTSSSAETFTFTINTFLSPNI